MMRKPLLCLAALLLSACGSHPEHPAAPSAALEARLDAAREEADSLAPDTCWLVTDGDGALWSGLYAAVTACPDYPKAEDRHGHWQRGPGYVPQNPSPEWSSWSRDSGVGLLAYGLRRRDLGALDRHYRFGHAHGWQMGEPLGDGRAIYSPNLVGLLARAVLVLGGEDRAERYLPFKAEGGAVDYRAHLAVMEVLLEGEVRPATLALDVTDGQLDLLRAQAERDPRDPLFQAAYARYTGDWGPALDACLAEDMYAGGYVRCDEPVRCQLAAWLFACAMVSGQPKGDDASQPERSHPTWDNDPDVPRSGARRLVENLTANPQLDLYPGETRR